jgi:uncharacterized protein YukJ
MALKSGYAVLKGHVIAGIPARKVKDHYSVHVVDDTLDYRLAVNIRSTAKGFGPDLWFYLDEDFKHPILDVLKELPTGRTFLPPNSTAAQRRAAEWPLDFIRMNLFDRTKMRLLPGIVEGANNDLNERIDSLVRDMIGDEDSVIYAFGEPWHEPNKKDRFFGFLPGNGVHNLHMNQGDLTGSFAEEDGVYQDGGLIFYYPAEKRYVAYFTKFQSQAWHTNDQTGHAIDGVGDDIEHDPNASGHNNAGGGNVIGNGNDPDFRVRIIAAMVNPKGPAPEHETVTLLNTTSEEVDLTGWKLTDKRKQQMALRGSLAKGAALLVVVEDPMQLANSGGIITLLNPQGVKAHGVSYTASQARHEGVTITFA